MGGICAYQLADVIVVLCAPNLQNLEGTQAMVRHFLSEQVLAVRDGRPVEILVVPARVDQQDTALRQAFEQKFEERFHTYAPAVLTGRDLRLWDMQIPYEPRYAFDEQVVTDPSRSAERRGLAASYQKLLEGIALLAPAGSALAELRSAEPLPVETRYDPTRRFAAADVFVSFGPGGADHARQIREALVRAGLTVATSPGPRGPEGAHTRADADVVQSARIGLVLIGPEDDWSARRAWELDQLLSPGARRTIRTVLLPGATPDLIPLPLVPAPVVAVDSGSDWLTRLLDALTPAGSGEAASLPSGDPGRNPFPGLMPFAELDSDVFVGRETEVRSMLARLREHGACCVVGPAGVGKTSAVFAGLVPELRRGGLPGSERWPVVTVKLGERPRSDLASALGRLGPPSGFPRIVLVIDQVESLFTLVSRAARTDFARALAELAELGGPVLPVAILRSDFLTDLEDMPELARLLGAAAAVFLRPLSNDKLREAIEAPASRHGVALEPGLADRLLADVAGEPGALTLLQYTLHELWLGQTDGYLTHHAYDRAGGAIGALARGADAVLDALSPDEREVARQLWLRLVEYEKNGARVRQPVEIGELTSGLEGGAEEARTVVERFIEQRLLSTSEAPGNPLRVALTSEALIGAWPTLRGWIDDSRGKLVARSRLDAAVREWVALGRDDSTLLSPERLDQLLSAMGDTALSALEKEFVGAARRVSGAGTRRVGQSATALRVFLSYTSELRQFPRGRSYVSEVERALSAAGHVLVDLADFPAADQPPARLCVERVRACDVYVGLIGTRYGTPVRDRPEVSYSELAFDAATEADLDRLVFLLDPYAENVGIPPEQLVDRKFGGRQEAFRRRVRNSGLVTQPFAAPARLGQLVERSLRELTDTRRRISSGIQREQVPAEAPVRASRFVNPPPMTPPSWFAGRHVEMEVVAGYLADPGIVLISVTGRGGIGKTALVCRVLNDIGPGVAGIVSLSTGGLHPLRYATMVSDLLRLLPPQVAQPLHLMHQDPRRKPREVMLALLEAFPAGERVVLLLDGLESATDHETESLTEAALEEALATVLTAPVHGVKVIATSRVPPVTLSTLEPGRQRRLSLDRGLDPEAAVAVLQALDDDGRLGLRAAPRALLDDLVRRTRGFPRALEAVKAILDGDHTLTPADLLDRTRQLPEDRVVQVLVGEAYALLDPPARQVMQALAVLPAPAPPVAVDFLLLPVNPNIDAAPILARLARRQYLQVGDGQYALHPQDRDFVLSGLAEVASLRSRAADYYARVRTPRETWRSVDDLRPQLAEFELRCDVGDYDGAAAVLNDIDLDYLQAWGHYRMLTEMHSRVSGRIIDPALDAAHLGSFGTCHFSFGDFQRAIELHGRALEIDRRIGNRYGQAADLTNLGLCHTVVGNYDQAINLHGQALSIARDTGDRRSTAIALANLGRCRAGIGDLPDAIAALSDAVAITQETGDRRRLAYCLGHLGLCRLRLGEYEPAAALVNQALEIARELEDRHGDATALGQLGRIRLAAGDAQQAAELFQKAEAVADSIGGRQPKADALAGLAQADLQLDDGPGAVAAATLALRLPPYPVDTPGIRLLHGLACLRIDDVDQAGSAFRAALSEADTLLGLTPRNVAASQVRALALSGLAVTADGSAGAALRAFAQVRADAPGLVAETRRLLEVIVAADNSGVLAGIGL
jgi:tetratricopeptide (TPR) repeat protein